MRFFGILNMCRGWQKAFVQIAQRGIWGGWKPRKCWVFPHYMWVCIDIEWRPEGNARVPSLYVRVYRTWANGGWTSEPFPHYMWGCIVGGIFDMDKELGSLIICEGVSRVSTPPYIIWQFPHYMWGCIDSKSEQEQITGVPSLYVKVYRYYQVSRATISSSLIICEGVSGTNTGETRKWKFPHYMWGCIVASSISVSSSSVPSLYVRVYRMLYWGRNIITSSLIICEGVSVIGYWFRFSSRVPSLYVRVYHDNWMQDIQQESSLIICEGVSVLGWGSKRAGRFPHYMWGCIE